MNDYTAYQIARSHQRELIAEAERARRVRQGRHQDVRVG